MNKASGWRPALESDLQVVYAMHESAHKGLPESREVLEEKFQLFPHGWLVFEKTARIVGYGISYPWRLYTVPVLNSRMGTLPKCPNCLFLHDLALLPEARGKNSAQGFLQLAAMLAASHKLQALTGVSLYGSSRLWVRYGFAVVNDPTLNRQLCSYGPNARYVLRPL